MINQPATKAQIAIGKDKQFLNKLAIETALQYEDNYNAEGEVRMATMDYMESRIECEWLEFYSYLRSRRQAYKEYVFVAYRDKVKSLQIPTR